jgi:hypothetical protein
MAVHAHALDLVNDPGTILAVFLGACFRNLAPHILEEIFRETLLLCHSKMMYIVIVELGSYNRNARVYLTTKVVITKSLEIFGPRLRGGVTPLGFSYLPCKLDPVLSLNPMNFTSQSPSDRSRPCSNSASSSARALPASRLSAPSVSACCLHLLSLEPFR